MIQTSSSSPVFSALSSRSFLHRGMAASLLLLGALEVQAVEDDEDFNAIMSREKDPYAVNDWRLGYTMLPAGAKVSIIDGSDATNPANYERETNWDLTGRTSLMWMTPWSGVSENGDFILGIELGTNHCVIESSPSSPEIDLRTYQVTLHPGLAWLLDREFHIEINPFVSVGHAQFEQNLAGDGSGLYWEAGLRAAAYYTWSNGYQLGMQIGYLFGKAEGELGESPTFDGEFEIQGMTVGIQLGYRL
jgi:hypothetical protein